MNRNGILHRLLTILIVGLLLSGIAGCRPGKEEMKEEKEETRRKEKTRELEKQQATRDAKQLLEKAKVSAKQLQLEAAFDMLEQAEKKDKTLKLEVQLYINRLGGELVTYCDNIIKKDRPATVASYYGNPNWDPLIISKNILDFILDEDRFKETTKNKANEVKAYRNKVEVAREKYLRALRLIDAYERVKGVNILKELKKDYYDTTWGLAAGEYLIRLGET